MDAPGPDPTPSRPSDGATDLRARYGAPAPWRGRALKTALGVVGVAAVGWLAWVVLLQAAPPVSSGNLTFDIVDDRTATARFGVDLRDDDVDAVCTLRAYAADHTVVGSISFTPEPDAAGFVEQTIATERAATAVELVGCTSPGQGRPR